jgi:hypothetical protein
LKNKEGKRRQDCKLRHKSDEYKSKKKTKAMQAMWSAETYDNDINDSSVKSGDEQELSRSLTQLS